MDIGPFGCSGAMVAAALVAASRQLPAPGSGGGTSSAGLRSKKPQGLSAKPIRATGMTGQSSGRGTW